MSKPYWQGSRVRLRAVEPDDAAAHFVWNQDAGMTRPLDYVWFPQSRAAAQRWAENLSLDSPPVGDVFHFVIETLAGELAGALATHNCDRRVGSFGYGVAIREEQQRQGYASEAIVLVLRHFFEELRYQKATVTVYGFNEPSIRLHERLGFQREGQVRRMVYTQGQHFDLLYYGITGEEFAARHSAS
ncbi:MAG TPA: GNAT family protein [Ktedonobacterales bacterium]|jgi:RimJ/RimL family protein N-acetyltransferase